MCEMTSGQVALSGTFSHLALESVDIF